MKGEANQQDYGMRIYDPRLGRFLSTDPLTQQYAALTPYQFSSNNPIAGIDMDGLEFLSNFKAFQTQKFNAEILSHNNAQAKSNSAPANPPKPIIAPNHSEASIPMQQLKARANAMRPVSTEEQKKKNLAEMQKRAFQNQASVSATKPQGAANEFEAGAVQGTQMAAVAVAAEACPTCFIAYGGTQVYNGIKNNDPGQIVAGSLNIVGGGIIKAGTISSAVNIPARLARVIPEEFAGSSTLGKAGSADVFVADASQLKGLTTSEQIAQKLTLQNSDGSLMKGPFRVIEFDAPSSGVAQPFNRNNPGFINGGKTAGGATEYVIPNSNITDLKNVTQTTIH